MRIGLSPLVLSRFAGRFRLCWALATALAGFFFAELSRELCNPGNYRQFNGRLCERKLNDSPNDLS